MRVFGPVVEVSRCQRWIVLQVAGWVSMCLGALRYFDWVGWLKLLLRMALHLADLPGLRDLGGLRELLSLAKCVPLALKLLQMLGYRLLGLPYFVVWFDLVR